MSTSTAIPLAYRCTKCWQMTNASSDQVGQSVPCISCSTPVVVPEATEQMVEAGQEFASSAATPDQQIEFPNENLSHQEITKLAQEKVNEQIRQTALETGSFEALSCSRWKRFFGSIIDSIAGMASVAIGLALAMLIGSASGGEPDASLFLVMVIVPAMLGICQLYMIAVEGRTVGKYCVKSKIVNLKGQPPGVFQGIVMRIIVIGFLGMIPFFGLINACWIFNPPKRCLHDIIAGTYVIDA